GSGSFFLKTEGATGQQNGINNSVQALATNYLAAAQSYEGPALYSLTKLSNASYQDLVVASAVNAVPEPETYALFLGGLGVIGLLARRRLPR
ncbi:PEP-CTERM sorting domain-containing protein, partial [Roseateles sp. P5_E11]